MLYILQLTYIVKNSTLKRPTTTNDMVMVVTASCFKEALTSRPQEKSLSLFYYKYGNDKHDNNDNINSGDSDGKNDLTITTIVNEETNIHKNKY